MKILKTLILLANILTISNAQQVSWVVNSGGPFTQTGIDCATMADRTVVNAGMFTGQTSFLPGDSVPRISQGASDIFVQKVDTNGITEWVVTFGGKGADELNQLAVDGEGNILLVGSFRDTVDFNPGSGVDLAISKGQSDIYLLKLDAEGNYLWSRCFGGMQLDEAITVGTDENNNIYIGGSFGGTVDFSTDSIPDLQNSFGANAGFLMKLNKEGVKQWFRKYGSGQDPSGVQNLTIRHTTIWMTGTHTSDSLNLGSAHNPLWVYSNEPSQTYLLQLDLNGNAIWVGAFNYGMSCNFISTDINSNVFLIGSYTGSLDLDPGLNIFPVNTTSLGDIFIIKLDSNANFLWAKTFDSPTGQISSGKKLVTNVQGDIILLAEFRGSVDFDPGPGLQLKSAQGLFDVAILRLNSSGEFVWLHTYGGSGPDWGIGMSIEGEKVYVTGAFSSTVNFNPSGMPHFRTATGNDAYLLVLDGDIPLHIPENDLLNYKIYPNPTAGLVKVEGEFDFIQLMNLQGQILYRQVDLNEIDILDFTPLNDGIYLLQLSYMGKSSYQKLVIKH